MRKVLVAMNTSRRKHSIAPIKLSIAAINSASTTRLMRMSGIECMIGHGGDHLILTVSRKYGSTSMAIVSDMMP